MGLLSQFCAPLSYPDLVVRVPRPARAYDRSLPPHLLDRSFPPRPGVRSLVPRPACWLARCTIARAPPRPGVRSLARSFRIAKADLLVLWSR